MTCCLTWRSLLFEGHTVARYTDKWHFTYARKNSTIPRAPIFTKLANAPYHYVHISYSESHPNRTLHVGTTNRHSLTPVRKGRLTQLNLTKVAITQ